MLSNNPSIDNFRFIITDDFFIPALVEKYNMLLKQRNYPLFDIRDMLIESIQNVETPSFNFDPYEQMIQDGNGAPMPNGVIPSISSQALAAQKRVSVTFRHSDGFLTYWFLFEHYVQRFLMGDNPYRKPFSGIIIETYSNLGFQMCRSYYNQCFLLSMPAILFSYDQPDRNAIQFNVDFHYNTFTTSINIPEIEIK